MRPVLSFNISIFAHYSILTFSIADILSEDSIIKWYKESHSSKGKSVFLEQTKKFVEWLMTADEEEEDEDGDED